MDLQAHPTPELIKEIVEIAVDAELPGFTMDGNFYEDYAMDSLGAIALVVEVNSRLKLRLPDERMPDIRTGQQLLALILELGAAASAAPTDAQASDATHAAAAE